METIDVSKWKRDKTILKKSITIKDNKWLANEQLYIMFPSKYIDKGMTTIENTCKLFGIISISNDKNIYSFLPVSTQVLVTPDEMEEVVINDEPYYKLTIYKGNALIDDTRLVAISDNTYNIFDLFLLLGKVPWYIGYKDLFIIFKKSNKYTGNDLKDFYLIIKILIAISARDKSNPKNEFRKSLKSMDDIIKKKPLWIGVKNIYYSFNSTMSKLVGAYMNQGMIAAIVNPEEYSTDLENIVRK